MKHRRSSKGIWLDIGILIICLAVITSCLSSGMFAKFVTGAESLKDQARLASFRVVANLRTQTETPALTTDEGSSAEYVIELENKSDVAVKAALTLDFSSEAAGLSVVVKNVKGTALPAGTVDEHGVVSFADIGSLAPHSSGSVTVTVSRGEYQGSAETIFDFAAKVLFSQID